MEVSNDLKKMLNVYPDKTSLDTNVKYLFSRKEVAGYLLKFLIPEFSDLTVEQAIDYIVETQVSKNEVSENYGDGSFQAKKSTKIQNISTESKVVNEKTIFFDIKFLVKNPKYENGTKNGTIEFVINIEIQNNPKPGYKIEQRGIYYCSRLISEQLGALTENTDYSSLNKVYSLWIVRGAEKDHIKNYRIVDENGNQNHDANLMQLIIANITNKRYEESVGIFDFLHCFLDSGSQEKGLKRYYENMNEDLWKEVENMCNLSESYKEEGRLEGIEEGKVENQNLTKQVFKKLSEGKSLEEIAKECNVTITEVQEIFEIAKLLKVTV